MCGIIGYIGEAQAVPILVDALRRLEYRGYDSAGVAAIADGELSVSRAEGKLGNLERKLQGAPLAGKLGIGHTRWATHGRPSDENAHPHCVNGIAVVHNGIIENHLELRASLAQIGCRFNSETDTELVAHLIFRETQRGLDLERAVVEALRQVRGAYALVIISRHEPDKIICAKNASPLILGVGDGEQFVASDFAAILSHTREMIVLDEGEYAVVTRDAIRVHRLNDGERLTKTVTHISWSPVMAEKGGFKHFMLKEIFEQPRAITDTMRGRISLEQGDVFLDEIGLDPPDWAAIDRVTIVACGTSFHAAMIGKYYLEQICRLPVEVDLASEYRYREPIAGPSTLFLTISQSGETADTLAALQLAKRLGARSLTISNVVASSIPRASDGVIYTHAGPEIGVASTKAFTTQIAALLLITCHIARRRGVDASLVNGLLAEIVKIPAQVEELLQRCDAVKVMALEIAKARSMLYLGRGVHYPIALEGALKIKEISYIHAEGYAAGEMKHGPIALIDERLPVVIVMPKGSHYEKIFSNLEQVRARGAQIVAVGTDGDPNLPVFADFYVTIPDVPWYIQPLLATIPLQLLAYYVADLKGTDIDQPRNLAKSVTVE